MSAKNKYVVVLITCKRNQANKIAKVLVEKKLAACVNIINSVKSFYWWKEKIVEDKESLLFCKTKKSLYKNLEKKVKEIHSYTIPEIISLEIKEGNKDYLNWINNSIK